MKNTDKIIKLVTAALMAAMTFVITRVIQIPIGTGYIHPGDSFVILSGIILGPIYGGFAAGIGSMLADLSSYPSYAPATFIIKLLAAMIIAYSYRHIRVRPVILAGIFGSLIVTSGYFIYELLIYGTFATAIANVPFNLLQNVVGIVLASIILPLLIKVPQIQTMMRGKKDSTRTSR